MLITRRRVRALGLVLGLATIACSEDAVGPFASHLPLLSTAADVFDGGLVVNGSFEDPVVPGLTPGWLTFVAGGAATIPGWVVTAQSVDIHAGEKGSPWTNLPDGAQAIDLTGSGPVAQGNQGSIRQDLSTIAGGTYQIAFHMSSNPANDPPQVQLRLQFGGAVVAEPTFVTNHTLADMRWDAHAYQARATDASTALEFTSLTPGCCGPVIDAVGVVLIDAGPPEVACEAGLNPSGRNTPRADNQDGFVTVSATDDVGVTSFMLGDYTLTSGETIKLTVRPDVPGVRFVNTMGPAQVRHFLVGPDDALLTATDAVGNVTVAACPVS